MEDVISRVNKLVRIIASYKPLKLPDKQLFDITENKINTPAGNVLDILTNNPSPLEEIFINTDLIDELLHRLNNNENLIRLNHVGFCYKVNFLTKEKERLIKSVKNSGYHLYQEPSNDDGLWFFAGNPDENIYSPCLEFVPVEKTVDMHKDYWLPHIQIDLDTNLSPDDIINAVKSVFGKEYESFPVVIKGKTYIIRNRLGIIDGVNFFLDLATNLRKVKYIREYVWNKIN